jgi:hypothetical protein
MVTFISGRQVEDYDLNFNKSNYHITLFSTGEDVTADVFRADKIRLFAGFDPAVDNDRLYREQEIAKGKPDPGPPLPTSTADLFVGYMKQDLASVGTGVENTVQTFIIFAIAGFVAYELLNKP